MSLGCVYIWQLRLLFLYCALRAHDRCKTNTLLRYITLIHRWKKRYVSSTMNRHSLVTDEELIINSLTVVWASINNIVIIIIKNINATVKDVISRTQELCESRGGRPGLPVPTSL